MTNETPGGSVPGRLSLQELESLREVMRASFLSAYEELHKLEAVIAYERQRLGELDAIQEARSGPKQHELFPGESAGPH